jgi:hypothetical protein
MKEKVGETGEKFLDYQATEHSKRSKKKEIAQTSSKCFCGLSSLGLRMF